VSKVWPVIRGLRKVAFGEVHSFLPNVAVSYGSVGSPLKNYREKKTGSRNVINWVDGAISSTALLGFLDS
jgi:hypothetical protein